MSTEQLVERFALERVSRNPAQFDEAKLRWLNGVYIRELSPAELARRLEEYTGRETWSRRHGSARRRSRRSPTSVPLAGPLLEQPIDDPAARARWLDEQRAPCAQPDPLGSERDRKFRRGRRAGGAGGSDCRARRQATRGVSTAARGAHRHDVSPGIFESVALLGREETLRESTRRCSATTERGREGHLAAEIVHTPLKTAGTRSITEQYLRLNASTERPRLPIDHPEGGAVGRRPASRAPLHSYQAAQWIGRRATTR